MGSQRVHSRKAEGPGFGRSEGRRRTHPHSLRARLRRPPLEPPPHSSVTGVTGPSPRAQRLARGVCSERVHLGVATGWGGKGRPVWDSQGPWSGPVEGGRNAFKI